MTHDEGRPGRPGRARRAATLGAWLALALPAALPAQGGVSPTDTIPRVGIIAGTVRDEGGRPVPLAILTVEGTARQTRSDSAGRFALDRVPAGIQELVVRGLGFSPVRAQVAVPADSAVVLAITLRTADVQALPGVRVEEQLLNQLAGVVVDEQYRPVRGAEVDLVGLRRSVTTDADGRFIFVDVPPGQYIIEVRAEGFGLARRGVQMVARIERDFAIRLSRGLDSQRAAALARVVADEADRRKSLAGARSFFVGRDELDRWDNAPLITALMGGPAALAMRELGGQPRDRRLGRVGAGSIDPRGTAQRQQTTIGVAGAPNIACVLVDGHEVTGSDLLGFFRANEVELVEIFPPGTENSRTMCGRFPPSSGCSCPPDPAGIVVWLRK